MAAPPPGRDEPADFETAIEACGFGLFNVFIMCCAVPCLSAMVFSASTISYILPTAECDLNLSLVEKGMIISAIPWGFIADTMGRRLVLICGGWIDGIFVLCAALSQNPSQLMVFKFFDGFIICGPFAVVVSYLAEFHGKKHRPYIMLFVGLSVSMAALVLPLIAYFLLPLHLRFNSGPLHFHTWHIFVAVTAVPSFLSGFLHIFLPESPKFLMAQGNYNKALLALQRIYALNKHKSRDSYPVKKLTDDTPDRSEDLDPKRRSSFQERYARAKMKFINGFKQLKPMFSSPYLTISLQVYFLHFCQIMSVNSVRLWLPQIFATMRQFEMQGINDTSMCAVLKHNSRTEPLDPIIQQEECDIHQRPETYQDNIMVAIVGLIGFLAVFPLLRIARVANHILKICLFLATFIVGSLYFAQTTWTTLILAAIYLTLMGICATTVISMTVVIFPTLMRTMVILLIMTCGRLGSVSGNLLLPIFIQINCVAPFVWLCFLMIIAFTFAWFLRIDSQQTLN
ncbi:synaptic vesicle glycoprotein 2B isoform X2 [Scaptodrosophila lebanonensis]|uniref:Synaptic vesicle glycoprotein 2B isoform X2 n=1 Tax=Drosophila lebanonensis TaxID=7225 RepID=A0A6J2TAM4_DROLE|nr:synaptic vesicle glycoprotein 2B isoform X2 [Scaptodrosophila lebanonensis]